MILRVENWPTILHNYILKQRFKPFIWGENDCSLFPCNCVLEFTGKDFAESFRGKYTTEAGAKKVLKDFAGGGLVEAADKIARINNISEISVNFAQRGDIVLVNAPITGFSLGIIDTNSLPILVGKAGLLNQPLRFAEKAWRIS